MGYSSDVAYKIIFCGEKERQDFISLIRVENGIRWACLKECEVPDDRAEIRFSAQCVKWYDSFDDVKGHEQLLDFVDEHFGEDAGYRYLRLGEDMDDNVDKNGGNSEYVCWDMSLARYLDLDFDGENYQSYGDALKEKENDNA